MLNKTKRKRELKEKQKKGNYRKKGKLKDK